MLSNLALTHGPMHMVERRYLHPSLIHRRELLTSPRILGPLPFLPCISRMRWNSTSFEYFYFFPAMHFPFLPAPCRFYVLLLFSSSSGISLSPPPLICLGFSLDSPESVHWKHLPFALTLSPCLTPDRTPQATKHVRATFQYTHFVVSIPSSLQNLLFLVPTLPFCLTAFTL